MRLAAVVPVDADRAQALRVVEDQAPLPASFGRPECRSPHRTRPTRRSPRVMHAPPATINGFLAERMAGCRPPASTSRAAVEGHARSPAPRRVLRASRTPSACTSCGSDRVTAPVSAGSVSTRIARHERRDQLFGPLIRSKYRDTGRNASLTVTSSVVGFELLQHGGGAALAKVSPGAAAPAGG